MTTRTDATDEFPRQGRAVLHPRQGLRGLARLPGRVVEKVTSSIATAGVTTRWCVRPTA